MVNCFNCKKSGHTPKYCPESKKVCILCNHLGHVSSECGFLSQIISTKINNITLSKIALPCNIKRMSFIDLNNDV